MSSSPPRHLLLAEDSEHDVELVLAALEENHLSNEVVVVRDGAEALDYLFARGSYAARATALPAAVLLDLKMPRVDGLEVLRIMKADAALKNIPVVMLTSSREEKDLARCYALGANAYVVKPVDFAQFGQAVHHLGCFWGTINEPPPTSRRKEGA